MRELTMIQSKQMTGGLGATKLLSIEADPKTVKGSKQGYLTAILYLTPSNASGRQFCPMAKTAKCDEPCLNSAGRGGIARKTFNPYGVELPDNVIQRARLKRSQLFIKDRERFMKQLTKEIAAFSQKAHKRGLKPCIRLNGTSDIAWENIQWYEPSLHGVHTIFSLFPYIQFYDYTKVITRLNKVKHIPNYDLSLSYSGANDEYARSCLYAHFFEKARLVQVVRNDTVKRERMSYETIIDGDETDLRFLDKPGSLVLLRAKGKARKDRSGFVLDHIN